jgi:hypothetical protein
MGGQRHPIPSVTASHRRVEPSTSVNRNVTTPDGAAARSADTPAECDTAPLHLQAQTPPPVGTLESPTSGLLRGEGRQGGLALLSTDPSDDRFLAGRVAYWFNPSIAHQHYRSSEAVFDPPVGWHGRYDDMWTIGLVGLAAT